MRKAIVLLSGGQDSTTCLFWAKDNFDKVIAVGFDYGQQHRVELVKAKGIADIAGVGYKVFDIKGLLGGSSLINGGDHGGKSEINADLPASFVAGRNLLFLTIAAGFGVKNGVNDIITGVCQTDYSGYPDCRRHTMDAAQLMLTLGLGVGDIRIHTPLMYLTKAETWKMAKDLGCIETIIAKTMTDYNGSHKMNEWGYGELDNPASELRAKGYYEAKKNGWI